jgi:hypothetical protein
MRKVITPLIVIWLISYCANPSTAQAQGTFQDLDFESATLSPTPIPNSLQGFVPISSALPRWTAYLGDIQQSEVLQNAFYNSTASIDILGPNWGSGILGVGTIDGNYTVYLQSGEGNDSTDNASIAQTGTVPATAESLQFKAWEYYIGTFSVSFAGNNLPLVLLSTGVSPYGQQYDIYGADIAPYAGETGQLEFTQNYSASDPGLLLDDISFSTNAVTPEPGIVSLTAIGGLLFGARKWFARR